MRCKVTAIIVCLLMCLFHVQAQVALRTDFYMVETGHTPRLFISKTLHSKDSNALKQETNTIISAWQWAGYLNSRLDSLSFDSISNKVFLIRGRRYTWQSLRANDTTQAWLNRASEALGKWDGAPLQPKDMFKANLAVLWLMQDKGYPFASVSLDSVSFPDSVHASGRVSLHPGPMIIIDSVRITGGVRLSKKYIEAYLKIAEGDVYNESLLAAIVLRLKELPFVDMVKPPAIMFYGSRAKLILYLKNRNASRADILLALGRSNDIAQRLTLTGEGHLALVNSMAHGESLNFDFNKLQPLTTRVNLGGSYPYLFNKPYGLDMHLELFKQDSNFLNVTQLYGFQYFKQARQYIKMYVKLFSSQVLTIDTNAIKATRTLPAQLDVNTTSYGFQVNIVTTDFKLNPSRGWELNADISVSLRTIKKNQKITNLRDVNDTTFKFSTLYDAITLQSTYYAINGYVRRYISFGRLNIFKLAVTGAAISNLNVGTNELYRVGGLSSLRGFAEQSFYTPAYAYATIEYRLRLGELSYAFLFLDKALLKSVTGGASQVIQPYSIGAGLTFSTKAGLFAISYAAGTIPPDAINVKNAKVQFGYTGYF